ncbi:unnamed protein product [Lupinus luteus]|uniref:Transmembrane protein n=1 Tax=Lupinus luteus TaxID=3873 RepID=A0AAV1W910_LUPLU
MVWPLKERRGPAWKQGWTKNTLSSISAPPFQLVAIVSIVMFLLLVPSFINFKSTMHTATINFNIFLLLLPLVLIFIAHFISRYGESLVVPVPRSIFRLSRAGTGGGGSPWGVAALVVLLLVLALCRSNFRSMWSPLVWRSY